MNPFRLANVPQGYM